MKNTFYAILALSLLCACNGANNVRDGGESGSKPEELSVGAYLKNPLGFNLEDASLSWQLPLGENIKQSAYQIQIFDGGKIVADTGKVFSGESARVENPLKKIPSRKRFYWRVKVWFADGSESPWSDKAFFEAGLTSNADWEGKWISSPEQPRPLYKTPEKAVPIYGKDRMGYPPTHLRKTFDASGAVSARLYVASLGIFSASINGKKVGSDYWGTGWTVCEKRVQTNSYDVSALIKNGKNAIAATIADGWYSGRIHRSAKFVKPEFLAQLELTFADGSRKIVATDASWKTSSGGALYADIYDGEAFDASLEPNGWENPDFDDSAWKAAAARSVEAAPLLEPRRNQPIVVKHVVEPKSVKKVGDGAFQFDFGQNLVGIPRVKFKGKRGSEAVIRYAEMLKQDGSLYTENYRSAISTDYYKFASDAPETFEPKFTYHGYRYVEISGLPADAKAEDIEIQSLVIYNDMPETIKFSCDIEIVNQLQQNIVWGQRSNYFSVPTDCPQRDERMGWTGDAQIFAPTAAYNMNINAFFKKWLFDLDDEQRADGKYPHVAPLGWGGGSPAWSDAGVICPWEIYVAYADKDILSRHYSAMAKWVEYMKKTSKNLVRPDEGYGDWLQPSTTHGSSSKFWRGNTPRPLIGTAYFYKCAKIMESAAKVLGKTGDEKYYAKLSADIAKAFEREFVKPDGTIATNSQTGYLLALDFDILPEEMRPKAFEKLVKKLEADNWYLDTGFVGTPILTPVLSRFGRHDDAVRMLLNEGYPSWLYPIKQGATTMWERWNSYSHENGFGEAAMNSFNHYAYGAIGAWIYREIGGIAPDPKNAGYKNIIFAPRPSEKISRAELEYKTPYGTAKSAWKIENGKMKWHITVPSNSSATVVIPAADAASATFNGKKPASLKLENVPSGNHHIVISKIKY